VKRHTQASHELVEFCVSVHPGLVRLLRLYLSDEATSDELAQEALVRVCLSWDKVRQLDAPEAWARRVALNLANSWLRRVRVERRARGWLREQGDQLVDLADTLAVRHAVGTLPARQRMAVILRYYEDLPVKEVAATMGCAEGTVRALTSQAVTALRSRLGISLGQQEEICSGA
jgi:RNA polymerase sigma factor (sigma-70 family)